MEEVNGSEGWRSIEDPKTASETKRWLTKLWESAKNWQRRNREGRADHVRPAATTKAQEVEAPRAVANEQRRFELLYESELGSRYHRRRASFLRFFDTTANALILVAGATAFGGIVGSDRGIFPGIIAGFITFVAILQVVTRPASAASDHAGWFKRWSILLEEIELDETPDQRKLASWTSTVRAIDRECVAELRALCVDCENITARRLGVPNRYRKIWLLQRWTMQLGTWQWNFPFETDPLAIAPERAATS